MNKTFCDRCNTEITDRIRDMFYIKVQGVALGNLKGFESTEICRKCRDEIVEVIMNKEKGK